MTRKRQRRRLGDVVQISLGDGRVGFGRVLESPLVAFYDLCSSEVPPLDVIVASPIAFKVWVMNYAIKDGDWPVIGNMPLADDLLERPRFYKQDPISKELSIYLGAGKEIPATMDEIEGLECAAVWEPEHAVDRLLDHLAGRENKWVESMRPTPR